MQQRRLIDTRKQPATRKEPKWWRKRIARLCAAAGIIFAASALIRS